MPAPVTAGHDDLGLVRLGPALLAIPIAALREVAICPPTLHAMALGVPGLAGALHLRQQQVPVLDLGPRLGQPGQQPAAGKVVVILSWQRRRIGLLVDEVCGMAPARPGAVQPLGGAAAAGQLTAALVSLDDGRCASLLDVPALAATPGLPWVDDDLAEAGQRRRADATHAADRVSLLLFDADPMPLAIEAMAVHTTVPEAPLRANALTSELCGGVIDYQGRQIPVLDTLHALGLGRQPPADQVSCLLLGDGQGGLVALRLDRVRDITAVPRDQLAPMPALAVLDAGLFTGVFHCPQRGQHLVVSPQGLLAHPWVRGLAETTRSAPGAAQRSKGAAASAAWTGAESYLLFNAGQDYACPLRLVSEIIRLPRSMVRLEGRGELLGLHMHRGRAVPVLCLSRVLSHAAPADLEPARVLLVQHAGQMLGLVVQSISAIESARWHRPPRAMPPAASEARGLQLGALIEVPTAGGGGHHTVQVLDLEAWLARLTQADAPLDLGGSLARSPFEGGEDGTRTAGCDAV